MKLLEEVRQALRVKRYSYRTEQCYLRWIEQYIRFHKAAEGFRHPALLGAAEVEGFLTYLAVERHVSASTQNQALGALLFLPRCAAPGAIGTRCGAGAADAAAAGSTVA